MSKLIRLDDFVIEKLKKMKEELGFKTYSNVIMSLIFVYDNNKELVKETIKK